MEGLLLLPAYTKTSLIQMGNTNACKYCGKPINPSIQRMLTSGGCYCDRECSCRDHSGENSPHWQGGTDEYRGKNWNRQRALVRERDGGICQCCHRKPRKWESNFPIHHIIKARNFNGDWQAANDLSNLITLCPQCHPKAERGKIAVPVRLF